MKKKQDDQNNPQCCVNPGIYGSLGRFFQYHDSFYDKWRYDIWQYLFPPKIIYACIFRHDQIFIIIVLLDTGDFSPSPFPLSPSVRSILQVFMYSHHARYIKH